MTDSRDRGRRQNRGEFQQAVERLEKAVQDLVGSVTSEFSERATSFIDETTSKLEREFGSKAWRGSSDADDGLYGVGSDDEVYGAGADDGSDDEESRDRGAARRMRARRRRARYRTRWRYRSRRLYRDPANAKICGVCAGIANYYGMEHWVVRCLAVTGLIFASQIVFPAYWIAYFVMAKPPKDSDGRKSRNRDDNGRDDHSSPAPEFGTKLSPRRSLRNVQADLAEAELRLRRMETHVTSGHYELQKELNKIDDAPPVAPSSKSQDASSAVQEPPHEHS